ncbi:cupin domain-containing protein [Agarivorans sp. Z349TD_8]|uniref:cupin domain-containing protein n=1 Tax=Agarivorans sp. Z349TD_8 TaxID=3421434 RepID=UPI003D7F16DE
MANIFSGIAEDFQQEQFSDLLERPNIRIERIVSFGHRSPEQGWYDQAEHEWVMVLEGSASLLFEDGHEQHLNKGDYFNIPAHVRHKVSQTAADRPTIWLAVFYS